MLALVAEVMAANLCGLSPAAGLGSNIAAAIVSMTGDDRLVAVIRGPFILLTALFKLLTNPIISPFKGTMGMSFWVREALCNMLTSIVSNTPFGKRPGARDMTVFGSQVDFNNIPGEFLTYTTR